MASPEAEQHHGDQREAYDHHRKQNVCEGEVRRIRTLCFKTETPQVGLDANKTTTSSTFGEVLKTTPPTQ